jgi:hypothetical protein
MIGLESELRIDQRFDGRDYLIELDVMPLLSPPRLPSQRLTVAVNGWVVGQSTVDRVGRFGYRIPAAALAGKAAACIVLSHPDAATTTARCPWRSCAYGCRAFVPLSRARVWKERAAWRSRNCSLRSG